MWPFTRSSASRDADDLLAAVQAASRQPPLYGPGRVPDTLVGRFELLTVFASLALLRLRNDPDTGALAQNFTDKLFRLIDSGLREDGVGDLTVPKKMHKLAGDFYGRLTAYIGPLERADRPALEAALVRNIGLEPAFAADLAAIAVSVAVRQAAAPISQLDQTDSWFAASP